MDVDKDIDEKANMITSTREDMTATHTSRTLFVCLKHTNIQLDRSEFFCSVAIKRVLRKT